MFSERLLCVYAWEYSNENDIYGFDSHRTYILVGGVDNTEVKINKFRNAEYCE